MEGFSSELMRYPTRTATRIARTAMTDAHLEFIQSLGLAPESVAAASHPIDEIDRRNKPKMSFLSIFDFFSQELIIVCLHRLRLSLELRFGRIESTPIEK
jgi:hypothetical protein